MQFSIKEQGFSGLVGKTKINCVIPCYNNQETIGRCLQSLLVQSFPVEKITICDDGSTDQSLKIVHGLLEKSSIEWKILTFPQNQGIVRNFRRCFQQDDSEFLLFCAANDIFYSNHLRDLLQIVAKDPDCVLAYGHCEFLADDGVCKETSYDFSNVEVKDRLPSEGFVEAACTYHRATPLWGLYRTEALQVVNPFRFYPTADAVFIAELATLGNIQSTEDITWARYFPYTRTRESLYRLTGPRPFDGYVSPWIQFPTIHRIRMMYRAFYEARIPRGEFEEGLRQLARIMENRWKRTLRIEQDELRKRLGLLSKREKSWLRDEVRSTLRFHQRLLRKS